MNKGRHKKQLSKQQAILVKAVVDPKVKTLTEAGEIAGYADRQSAHKALKVPEVQRALQRFIKKMEDAGATEEKSARVISEAMDAEKVEATVGEDGEPSEQNKKTFVKVADHPTRLKANEQFLKIKRLIGSDEEEKDKQQPIQILIVDYGRTNTNTGEVVPGQEVGSGNTSKPVKISADCLAQKGQKNNSIGQ